MKQTKTVIPGFTRNPERIFEMIPVSLPVLGLQLPNSAGASRTCPAFTGMTGVLYFHGKKAKQDGKEMGMNRAFPDVEITTSPYVTRG